MRQGLDFEEMEERTKVRKKYLRHLEDERFDQLPGHTYTKGFLQVYADALGLDGRLYVEEYNSRYVAGDDEAAAPRLPRSPSRHSRRRDRRESGTVGIALAAILLVTALVIAAWRFGGPDTPKVEGVNSTPPRSTASSSADAAARDRVRARRARTVVHGGPGRVPDREAALHGDAREGSVAALHEEVAVPRGRSTRKRAREGGRQAVHAAAQPGRHALRGHGRLVRVSRPRAAIVVTGSELVRGERDDRNGPYYAREALSLGLTPERIVIVGDDPVDLESALRAASDADVCLVSGGLGPTHDDRTVELVARVAGAPLRVDDGLESQIEAVSRSVAERLGRPYTDFAAGVTKQATIPDGAEVIGVAGTAPGLVLAANGCVFVVLPGPPGELRRLWPRAVAERADA